MRCLLIKLEIIKTLRIGSKQMKPVLFRDVEYNFDYTIESPRFDVSSQDVERHDGNLMTYQEFKFRFPEKNMLDYFILKSQHMHDTLANKEKSATQVPPTKEEKNNTGQPKKEHKYVSPLESVAHALRVVETESDDEGENDGHLI